MSLCLCGCGRETTVAKRTSRIHGMVKGQPMRCIQGHAPKGSRWGKPYQNGPWYRISENGCWEWLRSKDRYGYGQYTIMKKTYRAHRVVYEGNRGPIPDGLFLDHLCGNHGCVNPDHMDPVSHSENLKRGGYAHGRPV